MGEVSWLRMDLHGMGCFMGIMLCSPVTILEFVSGWTGSYNVKEKSISSAWNKIKAILGSCAGESCEVRKLGLVWRYAARAANGTPHVPGEAYSPGVQGLVGKDKFGAGFM